MKHIIIRTGAYEVNCHVIWNVPGCAFVIDPGADAEEIIRVVKSNSLALAGILCTHGHCDHISAICDVLAEFPVPVVMSEADSVWAFTPLNSLPPYYAAPKSKPANLGATFPALSGDASVPALRIMPTPGHSPGSVCYVCDEARVVFTGDTLFDGSIGRTDFPGGDASAMRRSLAAVAFLPDDYAVFPGHGGQTTIGRQKSTNPYLRN